MRFHHLQSSLYPLQAGIHCVQFEQNLLQEDALLLQGRKLGVNNRRLLVIMPFPGMCFFGAKELPLHGGHLSGNYADKHLSKEDIFHLSRCNGNIA
jgi:hypothetical protein